MAARPLPVHIQVGLVVTEKQLASNDIKHTLLSAPWLGVINLISRLLSNARMNAKYCLMQLLGITQCYLSNSSSKQTQKKTDYPIFPPSCFSNSGLQVETTVWNHAQFTARPNSLRLSWHKHTGSDECIEEKKLGLVLFLPLRHKTSSPPDLAAAWALWEGIKDSNVTYTASVNWSCSSEVCQQTA